VHFEFSGIASNYVGALTNIEAKKIVSCRGTAEKVKILTEPGRAGKLKNVFSGVDKIHCVSENMSETIRSLVNECSKIFVNRPSINPFFFQPAAVADKSFITVLSIGRFTFQKGFVFGLIAFKKLLDSGIQARWLIVGDGPLHEELIYHRAVLKLEEQVSFLGRKNAKQIKQLYSEADIFFLPSVYEGIANVVLEAMSMQLPVLSTKSGGMEEVIRHKENGLLVNVYDTNEMFIQLNELCVDKALRIQLGINARKTVLNDFTIERQIAKFETVYAELLKNSN
jgi:glycosyltransferase involved in cell wall biosynthesis